MKNRIFSVMSAIVVSAMLITGCQSVPQIDIDAAKAAVAATKAGGAELYAANSFVALQDSLSAVLQEVETENSNFFKNFDASVVKLQALVVTAQAVTAEADANKAAIKAEALALIEEVKALLIANAELVTKAPKGKEGATALLAIQAELATIEATIGASNDMLTADNVIGARDNAKSAKEKATSINAELIEVTSKVSAAKKK